MKKYTRQDLYILWESFDLLKDQNSPRAFIQFLSCLQDCVNSPSSKINRVVNKMFGKSVKRKLRVLLQEDINDMPLYLNHEIDELQIFARWRMRVGK